MATKNSSGEQQPEQKDADVLLVHQGKYYKLSEKQLENFALSDADVEKELSSFMSQPPLMNGPTPTAFARPTPTAFARPTPTAFARPTPNLPILWSGIIAGTR